MCTTPQILLYPPTEKERLGAPTYDCIWFCPALVLAFVSDRSPSSISSGHLDMSSDVKQSNLNEFMSSQCVLWCCHRVLKVK